MSKTIIAYRLGNEVHNCIDNAMFNAYSVVLDEGIPSHDRTGTGTLRKQHAYFTWNANEIFPVLKGKKMNPKSALVEAFWMLKGDTNTKFLKENGVNYWDQWADENGDLGRIYGYQMRNQDGIDQIQVAINDIITNNASRRIMVDLWNAKDLPLQKLPPCHFLYNFQVTPTENNGNVFDINMHVIQRSADSFLGVPYDFMLFNYILSIIHLYIKLHCHYKGIEQRYDIGDIHYTCNDFHIYINHIDQVEKYTQNYSEDELDLFKPETYQPAEPIGLMQKSLELLINAFEFAYKDSPADYPLSFDQYLNIILDVIGIDNLFGGGQTNGNYPFIKADVAV